MVPRVRVVWIPADSRNALNVLQHLLKIVPKVVKVNLCLVRDPVTVHGLIRLLEDVPLKSLRLETIDDHLACKLSRLSALRHLHINKPCSFVEIQSTCLAVPTFLEKFLLMLDCKVDALPITFQRLTDLRKLNIHQIPSEKGVYRQFSLASLEMLRKLTNLRLYLPETQWQGMNYALKGMDNLRELSLGFQSNSITDNRAQSVQLAFPSSLTSLVCIFDFENFLHADEYFSKLPLITSLRSLTLSGCGTALCDSLAPIVSSISTLNRLDLVTIDDSKVLIPRCTQIQQLSLIGCPFDADMLTALRNLTRLSTLEIEDCKFTRLKKRKFTSKRHRLLPSLKILTLTTCSSIQSLSPLLLHLSHLHSLELHSCVLDDSIVVPLQRMTLLHTLKITDCSIDDTSPCDKLLYTIVHSAIRHLWIDCYCAFRFKGCSSWSDCATAFGESNEKNILSIECTCTSLLCQHASQDIISESKNKGDL